MSFATKNVELEKLNFVANTEYKMIAFVHWWVRESPSLTINLNM